MTWPIGRTIIGVRSLRPAEREAEGWDESADPVVLVLSDKSVLFASRDEEGNGPGALFGTDPQGNGKRVYFVARGRKQACER